MRLYSLALLPSTFLFINYLWMTQLTTPLPTRSIIFSICNKKGQDDSSKGQDDRYGQDLQNTVTKLKLSLADKVLDANLLPISMAFPLPLLHLFAKIPYHQLFIHFNLFYQTSKPGRLNRTDASEILPKIKKTMLIIRKPKLTLIIKF